MAITGSMAKPVEKPLHGKSVAIIGKPVALTKSDFRFLICEAGGRVVAPGHPGCSLLLAGDDSADLVRNMRGEARVLTERELLQQIGSLDLLGPLRLKARNPATSLKQLCRCASVVPEDVAANSLWQLLHLEDQDFLEGLPGLLKLRLLKLLSKDDHRQLSRDLSGHEINESIFAENGVSYSDGDPADLVHQFHLGDFQITLRCEDHDVEMEDLGSGGDTTLSLGIALIAILSEPCSSPQDVAERHGIHHETNWSPCDGRPMYFDSILIERAETRLEYTLESFPDDSEVIKKLAKDAHGALAGADLPSTDPIRPLFNTAPVINDDLSCPEEGYITVAWQTDCYLPCGDKDGKPTTWSKNKIDFSKRFTGTEEYPYVEYVYTRMRDLEPGIAEQLEDEEVGELVAPYLHRVLGLPDGGARDDS